MTPKAVGSSPITYPILNFTLKYKKAITIKNVKLFTYKINYITVFLKTNFKLWNEGLYIDYLQKKYLNVFIQNFLITSTFLFNEVQLLNKITTVPYILITKINNVNPNISIKFDTLMLVNVLSVLIICSITIIVI